jgi:transposase
MEKIDARTLNQEAQEALRNQIIRLRKAGRKNREIAEIAGVSEGHCSRVWSRYQKDGIKAVAKGKRGRRHGEQRNLTVDQESTIKRLLIDKSPLQLKLSFALWNREAVGLLIQQQCGFVMPTRTVGEYLKRWGFTPQKPVKWAKEQSTPAVANWLIKSYPAIEKRARNPDWCQCGEGLLSERQDACCSPNRQKRADQHDLSNHQSGQSQIHVLQREYEQQTPDNLYE